MSIGAQAIARAGASAQRLFEVGHRFRVFSSGDEKIAFTSLWLFR